MPKARANGIDLEYDVLGDPAGEPLVLVMGMGMQMTAWPPGLLESLAGRGLHLVFFDNRDAGLSTVVDGPEPDLGGLLSGDASSASYLMADLADDTVGLMDALGIEQAHLFGVSLGGMIVQQVAIDHPERVLSLCSMMATTSYPSAGNSTQKALEALLAPRGTSREEAVEGNARLFEVVGSPAYPADPDELRGWIGEAYDRSFQPEGAQRQLAAVLGSPDRAPGLAKVTVPALVIHGEADQLITPGGGEATAAALPDAELLLIPGLGHDLPEQVWPTIVDAVEANIRRAV